VTSPVVGVAEAAEIVRRGGVVAVATDTLVGLLALALDESAVARVLALKGEARQAPIPVLLPRADAVLSVASDFPEEARSLARQYWPGALTLVLPARCEELPSRLVAGGTTVGVRVPGQSTALELLQAVGVPLTGTSANLTGRSAPVATADLDPALLEGLDGVVEGRGRTGVASTVVVFDGPTPRVLRGSLESR
jgi:L-threonylcarbamoyladenylate synthase